MSLKNSWGIICPVDCFCKDPEARKQVLEGRRLSDEVTAQLRTRRSERALAAGEKRLEIQRQLNISWGDLASLESELFHISLMKKKTLPRASRLIKDAIRIYKIIKPFSKVIEKYEMLLKHPEMDEYYFRLEL